MPRRTGDKVVAWFAVLAFAIWLSIVGLVITALALGVVWLAGAV